MSGIIMTSLRAMNRVKMWHREVVAECFIPTCH